MDDSGSASLESEQYSPLTLERRGIDLIPDSDRRQASQALLAMVRRAVER